MIGCINYFEGEFWLIFDFSDLAHGLLVIVGA